MQKGLSKIKNKMQALFALGHLRMLRERSWKCFSVQLFAKWFEKGSLSTAKPVGDGGTFGQFGINFLQLPFLRSIGF